MGKRLLYTVIAGMWLGMFAMAANQRRSAVPAQKSSATRSRNEQSLRESALYKVSQKQAKGSAIKNAELQSVVKDVGRWKTFYDTTQADLIKNQLTLLEDLSSNEKEVLRDDLAKNMERFTSAKKSLDDLEKKINLISKNRRLSLPQWKTLTQLGADTKVLIAKLTTLRSDAEGQLQSVSQEEGAGQLPPLLPERRPTPPPLPVREPKQEIMRRPTPPPVPARDREIPPKLPSREPIRPTPPPLPPRMQSRVLPPIPSRMQEGSMEVARKTLKPKDLQKPLAPARPEKMSKGEELSAVMAKEMAKRRTYFEEESVQSQEPEEAGPSITEPQRGPSVRPPLPPRQHAESNKPAKTIAIQKPTVEKGGLLEEIRAGKELKKVGIPQERGLVKQERPASQAEQLTKKLSESTALQRAREQSAAKESAEEDENEQEWED